MREIAMRGLFLAFALIISACIARAEPNVPQIAESAAAYRKSIEARSVDSTAARLLGAIKRAETAGKTAELLDLYEQLVALNSANFRAWLQLSLAWREAEPIAEKGLGAAFNAYGAARAAPDQLEALLVMSSFLRSRLERYRKDYETARADLQKAERMLAYLNDTARAGDALGLDPADPAGNLRRLNQARDSATGEAEQALQQIGHVAAALDETYRDIAAKVPGIDAERMKSGDSRSAIFATVLEVGTNRPRVDFRIEGADVRVCIEFTQDLRTSDLSYREFVQITYESAPLSAFGIEAKNRTLCISGLEPGKSYEVNLLQGLPSKQGAKLAEAIALERVDLPDLPQQIAFSGRDFILPNSGPGEVPLFATNVETFDLELYRITDRTLHRHIALRHIGGELPHKEYNELRDRFAERLWSGTLRLPGSAEKKNKTIKASLGVRALLEQRRQWLREQIGGNRGDQKETSSPPLPILTVADEQIRGEGRFFAGALPFEAAALDLASPGIFALITRDLSEPAGRRRSDCERDCGKFLVQWFLNTDIGLMFYEGDADFTVVARSLRSGEAKSNVRIELVSASNRVLASGTTDANGAVKFERSLTRGAKSNALVAILAHQETDFGFLTFGAERLDLSRLNVDGRSLTHGFNAFLTTDRGIYQPGETVRLLTLIRNADGVVPEPAPVATLRLEARDRVLVERRVTPQDWMLGGSMLALELPRTIRSGTARITLSVGRGDDAVIGETLVHIGAVRPDRARLNFVDPQNGWKVRKTASETVEIAGRVSAQYLYALGPRQGAARDLKAEVLVRVAAAETPARGCYDKFAFGRLDDNSVPVSSRHFVEYTDKDGNLDLRLSGIAFPEGTRPVAATVEVTLFDAAGPLASRSMVFAVSDDKGWIGVSKIPRLRPGSRAGTFDLGADIVSITPPNASDTTRLDVRVERERDLYIWERRDGTWQHIKSTRRELVTNSSVGSDRMRRGPSAPPAPDGTPCAPATQVQDLARDLEVGRYVLTVTDTQTGRQSSVRYQTGAAVTSADQLEPNIFTLSTDKSQYRPNEPIELTAEVSFDGELLVAFAEGDIKRWASGPVRNGIAKIKLDAPPEWAGKGIYALATAFRSGTDGTVSAGPGRAIGATHFEVRGEQAGYAVRIEKTGSAAQGYIAPNEELTFTACVADPSGVCSKTPPADAFAVAFVVDEGLLSLTGHHDPVPDPERHFYGRKRFGLRIMDNYHRLLLKEGGDRPGRLALSNFTSSRIVSLASGPVKLQNGSAAFTIPKVDLQNGSASILVVIWSRDYTAAGSSSVRVRSRVVADLDAPNFLLAGDRAVLPLRLENIDFVHQGEFAVRIAASGAASRVSIGSSAEAAPNAGSTAELRIGLRQNDAKTIYLALDTPADGRGKLTLSVALEAIGSPVALPGQRSEWTIDVRAPVLTSVDTISFPVRRQGTNLSRLVQGIIAESYDPERVSVTARFADSPRALLAASVDAKSEKTPPILDFLVWRGLLLLHAGNAGSATEQKEEIGRILSEVQSLQMPDGSFVPYRTLGDFSSSEYNFGKDEEGNTIRDGLFRTTGVLDFLLLARNAGYEIPDRTIRSARQFVEARLVRQAANCSFAGLYARLVLIASGKVEHDQVTALARCEYEDAAARAAAAAVSARYGLSDQANVILAGFQDTSDAAALKKIGDFRLAMMLSFLNEAGAPAPLVESIADVLLTPDKGMPLSQAAMAWITRAGAKIGASSGSKLTLADLQVDGAAAGLLRRGRNGVLESAPIPYPRLRGSPISVATRGDAPARGFLTIEGLMTKPGESRRLPASALKRRFFDPESGRELTLGKDMLRIGDRLVVVIEGDRRSVPTAVGPDGEPAADTDGPLLLADLLPSAFQIVSNTIFDHKDGALHGALGDLKPRGDLRAVETDSDRWIALIVPESKRSRQPGAQQPGTSDAPAAPAQPAPAVRDGEPEFRQGYLVRLNMAGRFTYPAASVEATIAPARTLWAEQSNVEIRLPDPSAR